MTLPIKPLPLAQNWDCHVSGSCCKEYQIPLTDEEVARIEAQGWTPDDLGGRPPFRSTGWFRRQRWLNHRDGDGACVFLSPEGRCRIHERFGFDQKPLPCRLFPFVLVPAGDHWRFGVRYACPSAAANKGRGAADHAGDLAGFARELAAAEGLAPAPGEALTRPPRLDDGTRLDWPDTLRLVDAVLKLLRGPGPMERRMRKVLHFVETMKAARLADLKGGKLTELLDLLISAAEQEVPPASSVPAPGWVGRVLFRQMAAIYMRKDRGPHRGPALRGVFSRLGAAWRFMRGTGSIPRMHGRIPACTFADAEEPRGPLPPEAEKVLERYYAVKAWSMQFVINRHRMPFWAGVEALAMTLPLILWVSRQWRDVPREQAVTNALTVVDDHFGINPVLGTLRQRMSLGILARRGEIARLIAWYSR
ncbi:MAG: YkgJ family cysteine cluster protein [Gemmataceae bacterium]|nr:YkgJ family cysteine cluster protein [Gemmataceae bacterium]